MSRKAVFAMVCGLMSVTALAHAQTASEGAATAPLVFEPDFFAAYAPRTALDMAERVPGFTIREGEERRGFAGASGNVLIDGALPAGKSEDIEDILERIPAADVVRIELLRGAGASASNAQAVRLNIVRRPSSGEGVWETELSRAEDGRVSPAGQASWSGRQGRVEYTLSAMAEQSHTPIDGTMQAFDAGGGAEDTEVERIVENETEARVSGEISRPFAGGALTLNASLSREDGRERQAVRVFDGAGVLDEAQSVDAREIEDIAEIGAAHTRTLGPWDVEFGALLTRRRVDEREEAIETDAFGAFDEAEREQRKVETGETIARFAAARDYGESLGLTLAAEAALNTLDQRLTLTEDDGSGPAPVIAPGANVRIEEWRGELSASLSWRPSARSTIEAGVAVETSTLEQSGDVSSSADLTFWKPSVQVLHSIGDDDQLRLRIYRDVGQLDFEDFAASAELESSIINAGNPDLRPETSWRVEAAADLRFEDAALELTLFYWAIEDALDLVPIGPPGDRFDARGNIGDATLWGARASFEAPLPLLEDARLRGQALWQESEATNPLTGATRPQSEIIESSLTLEFRHDITALGIAWGVDFTRERIAPEFRFDRVSDEQDTDEIEVWLEATRISGVRLRLFAVAFAGADAMRDRTFFDPDRTGAFDGAERRVRAYGPVFGLSLQGSF